MLAGYNEQQDHAINYLAKLSSMQQAANAQELDRRRMEAQQGQFGQEMEFRKSQAEQSNQRSAQEHQDALKQQALEYGLRDRAQGFTERNKNLELQKEAQARNSLMELLNNPEGDVNTLDLGKAILPYDTQRGIGLINASKEEQRQKALMERTGGTGVQPEKGYRWTNKGTLEAIPGGPADPSVLAQLESVKNKGAGAKAASEDERKAAGWLAQATNAYNNMANVAAQDKSVTAPGMFEAGAEALGLSGTANAIRSPQRQQFVQAASSFSEAALRAATGAGVNKDEAKQKIQELTPQYTDAEPVRAQKLESMKVYLDSLASRAGRADTGFIPERVEIPTGERRPQAQPQASKTFDSPAQADPRLYDGKTLTNPETGQKLVSHGGQWVRVK